jgi:2-polyprenyl-3-methyl-5-hydroxy-6-metoxy-1,4-benzoquinol methylase
MGGNQVTTTNEQVRRSVAEAYGSRVRPVLDAVELELPVVPAASCCAPAPAASSCCGPAEAEDSACCGGAGPADAIDRIAELYRGTDTTGLPESVTSVAFGCGNPTAIDALQPGETVLDLGSGGGIDCFLAAKMVGPTGRVIGVDMTPEMIALAERNLAKVGASNVEFRQGTIESLPVETASVDVIITNSASSSPAGACRSRIGCGRARPPHRWREMQRPGQPALAGPSSNAPTSTRSARPDSKASSPSRPHTLKHTASPQLT